MRRSIVFALGFLFAAFLIISGLRAPPALADMACGERAKVLASLAKNYAERPVAIALTSDGAVIEVLTSPAGTWSILVTAPGGPTCLVAGGENWQPVSVLPPRGSPANLRRPPFARRPAFADLPSPAEAGFAKAGAKPLRLRAGRSGLRDGGSEALASASRLRRRSGFVAQARRQAQFQPIAHLGCLGLDEVLDKLLERWGETLAGLGKSSDRFGRDLTVFFTTSPEGTYTMFAVRDGCAYFVSVGEAWKWLREGAK